MKSPIGIRAQEVGRAPTWKNAHADSGGRRVFKRRNTYLINWVILKIWMLALQWWILFEVPCTPLPASNLMDIWIYSSTFPSPNESWQGLVAWETCKAVCIWATLLLMVTYLQEVLPFCPFALSPFRPPIIWVLGFSNSVQNSISFSPSVYFSTSQSKYYTFVCSTVQLSTQKQEF